MSRAIKILFVLKNILSTPTFEKFYEVKCHFFARYHRLFHVIRPSLPTNAFNIVTIYVSCWHTRVTRNDKVRGTYRVWPSTFMTRPSRRGKRKSSHVRFRASVVRDSRLSHSGQVNLRPCELTRVVPQVRRLPHCRLAVPRNGDSLLTAVSCF